MVDSAITSLIPPVGDRDKVHSKIRDDRRQSRRQTMLEMNKFVEKAAVERKLKQETIKEEQESMRQLIEDGDGGSHNSGYWQGLDNSHESEDVNDKEGNASKMNNQELNNSLGSAKQDGFRFEIDDIDIERKIPRHMISPNSCFKLVWNILIMILAVYTAASLPIRLAF